MILVTGATGHFGRAVIEYLLKKGIPVSNISALVRDRAKAEDLKAKGVTVKVGDYDDYSSLTKAFEGTDQLLLVSGNDVSKRGKQHENAVKGCWTTLPILPIEFQRSSYLTTIGFQEQDWRP